MTAALRDSAGDPVYRGARQQLDKTYGRTGLVARNYRVLAPAYMKAVRRFDDFDQAAMWLVARIDTSCP